MTKQKQPIKKKPATAPAANRNLSVGEAIQLAAKHYSAGQMPQAENLLRQVLRIEPINPVALHLLGAVVHRAGKTENAIGLIKQAIEVNPKSSEFHSNLGEMYRTIKKLPEAIEYGEKAIALDPKSAIAHSNLGIAYFDNDEIDKAEESQKRALKLNPKLTTALNNLGSIARKRKEKETATEFYRKVLQINPNHLDALNNLGATLTESEQPEEAIKCLVQAIKLSPKYSEAHCNIANSFLALEKLDKAEAGFKNALALNPNYLEAYQGIAKLYQELQDYAKAEAMADKAMELAPEKAEVHSLKGEIFSASGYPDKAEAFYKKALEMSPDLVRALLGLGHLQMEQGHLKEAEENFTHALGLNKDNLGARLSLTMVKKVNKEDENMAALVAEAEKIDTMLEAKAMQLHFALGKCYDDTKQYDLAFKHYLEGCRLKRKRIEYSPENNDKIAENICNFFTKETVDRLRGEGCSSDTPIIVLGMPRSGTTLTEQIIASHPLVHGAGELPDLLRLASSPNGDTSSIGYPFSLNGITKAELKMLGEKYVAGLKERNPEARYITDKMPANFNCLGLLHLMLPNAKIIHVKRNPVDTCLSCFTRLFNKSQHQSYDLSEIGRYYSNYAKIMEHWRKVLPKDSFYEVQYEELVSDNENQARALIEYCGLEWNDACLESHKTERNIRTASVTQVRQPVYTSSVERWKKYEAHLGPLLEALGDLVKA